MNSIETLQTITKGTFLKEEKMMNHTSYGIGGPTQAYIVPKDKNVISATTDYSSNIVCSVEKENIFGTQFHPEKSDKLGLKIIENFLNL